MLTIDTETHMQGRLVAAGRIVLNSWFEGDVVCSVLEIGPDGYVLGSVVARDVIVEGQIVGPILAGRITVLPGGFLESDLSTTSLAVSEGATHTGRVRRYTEIVYPEELLTMETRTLADRAQWPREQRTPVLRSGRETPANGHAMPAFPLVKAARIMSL